MMYQVIELSIRKYQGNYLDKSMWEHIGYAVGIRINNKVYDYKTLEEYNFIDRNENGKLNVSKEELVEGNIYAIGGKCYIFDSNKKYEPKEIDFGINSSSLYSDEYKKMKRKKK